MLSLQRKLNTEIHIYPGNDIDPDMTVAELFADGAFVIRVNELTSSKVKLGFIIPNCLDVMRDELLV